MDSGEEEQKGGAAAIGIWGREIRVLVVFISDGDFFYRATYRASKNWVVPRASTMGRSGGPGTVNLSCRAGTKHY
jgi:hypothetical protein